MSIKQNTYVLRRAMELISVFDPTFIDFYTEYLSQRPGEKSQMKQAMFQFAIRNESDDIRLAKFLEQFFKVSELNKWTAEALIHRFGRGTSKINQRKLSKFVKNLAGGLNAQDRNSIPRYLVIVIAELCSNDIANPLQEDKYTIKPVYQAVHKYLEEETNTIFSSAIMNIYNGIELTEEENQAMEEVLP